MRASARGLGRGSAGSRSPTFEAGKRGGSGLNSGGLRVLPVWDGNFGGGGLFWLMSFGLILIGGVLLAVVCGRSGGVGCCVCPLRFGSRSLRVSGSTFLLSRPMTWPPAVLVFFLAGVVSGGTLPAVG